MSVSNSDLGPSLPSSSGRGPRRVGQRRTGHVYAQRPGSALGHATRDRLASALLSAFWTAPIAHAVLDRDGAILAVNEAWQRLAQENGASAVAENSIGAHYLEVYRAASGAFSEESREAAEGIQAVLDGAQSLFTLEYPCRSSTEDRFFQLEAVALADGRGGALVSHRNITERRRAEANARQQEVEEAVAAAHQAVASSIGLATDRAQLDEVAQTAPAAERRANELEAIFDAVTDGIALYDAHGYIVRANQALVQLAAVDRDPEYLAKSPKERTRLLHMREPATGRLLGLDERPVMRALRGEVLAGATAEDVCLQALDGREVDVNVSAAPVRDAAGRITGAVVVLRDVTERRRLERDAAERAGLIEGILDTMTDGIALCDGEGHLLAANRILRMIIAHQRYSDFSNLSPAERAELLHVRDANGRPIPPGGLPDVRALGGETLKDNTAVDLRIRMGDGSDVELNVTAAPVRDPAGRVTGAVTVWRDVTERRRLERELAERMSQMQAIFDAMVDGLVLFDTTGRAITANPALLHLVGFQATGGINRVSDTMSQEQRHTVFDLRDTQGRPIPVGEDPMQRILRGETLTGADVAEVRLRTLDGRHVEISVSGAPVRDQAGRVIGAAATVRDVTKRRRLERKLAERTSQIEGIFATMREGLAVTDRQGRIVLTNPAFDRLFALDRDAKYRVRLPKDRAAILRMSDPTSGRSLSEDDIPSRRALHGEVLADSGAMDMHARSLDGRELELNVSAAPLRDDAGRIIGGLTVYRDVTTRRHVERELAERASQIEAIFGAMADGVALCDTAGRIVRMNAAFGRLLQLDLHLDPAANPQAISLAERAPRLVPQDSQGHPLPEDEWPLYRILHGETLADEQAVGARVHRRDDHDLELSVSGAPVRDQDGGIVGAVMSVRDVTERRRAEVERAEMMSLISHELKHPLSLLVMAGGLIRRYLKPGEPPKQETLLQTLDFLDSGVIQMERHVTDLVDAARMEGGHLPLTLAPTDLAALARRVVDEQMHVSGRSLTTELPEHHVMAIVDGTRIEQVLINLLSNAFKYSSPETPVHLRLQHSPGQARFEVQDEGLGIPRESRRRIFERFYQVPENNAQSGSGMGIGLGLYICRQLVELHRGQIDVDSKVGRGSTFWFTLPLAAADM